MWDQVINWCRYLAHGTLLYTLSLPYQSFNLMWRRQCPSSCKCATLRVPCSYISKDFFRITNNGFMYLPIKLIVILPFEVSMRMNKSIRKIIRTVYKLIMIYKCKFYQ